MTMTTATAARESLENESLDTCIWCDTIERWVDELETPGGLGYDADGFADNWSNLPLLAVVESVACRQRGRCDQMPRRFSVSCMLYNEKLDEHFEYLLTFQLVGVELNPDDVVAEAIYNLADIEAC